MMRFAIALVCVIVSSGVAPAADEFVERVSELVAPAPGTTDVTPELFAALGAMEAPEPAFAQVRKAGLLTPDSGLWSEAVAWATSAPQQEVINAIKTATDPKTSGVIALPYGEEGVESSWIDAGLYVELGPRDTLAGADFRYLRTIEHALALCAIESTRLASEQKVDECMDVGVGAIRLARMLANRQFLEEKTYALTALMKCAEKLRDVVFLYPETFDPSAIATLNLRLGEDEIQLQRILLPEGDRVAAEQLISMTIEARGSAKPREMATLMSSIEAQEHPLRRFNVAAFWREAAQVHADWFETREQLDKLFGDWNYRWELPDLLDPQLQRLSDYRKMKKDEFLLLHAVVGEMESMFDLRMAVTTALHGTRDALACVGFHLRNKRWPPILPAVQPHFIRELDVDPYSVQAQYRNLTGRTRPFQRFEKNDIFEYFVPIRDQQWGPREEKRPYEVQVSLTNEPEGDGERPDEAQPIQVTEEDWASIEAFLRQGLQAARDLDQIVQFNLQVWRQARTLSREQVRAQLEQMMSMSQRQLTVDDIPSGYFRLLGIEDPGSMDAIDVLIDIGVRIEGTEPFISRFEQLADEQSVSIDEFLSAYRQALEEWATAGGAAGAGAGREAEFVSSLTARIDDSTFLLYSVGPDRRDDEARTVVPTWLMPKAEGTDVLIWPPVISLQRGAFSN